MRQLLVGDKMYLISAHAWHNIRKIDIDLADIGRIIETPTYVERLRHKTEYVGCYVPRYERYKELPRQLQVKIVVDTRSTLKLKTVHNMGLCPEVKS